MFNPVLLVMQPFELSPLVSSRLGNDNHSPSGWDSCDWGSDYGHTIQILNPTKRQNELEALAGRDLLEKRR